MNKLTNKDTLLGFGYECAKCPLENYEEVLLSSIYDIPGEIEDLKIHSNWCGNYNEEEKEEIIAEVECLFEDKINMSVK